MQMSYRDEPEETDPPVPCIFFNNSFHPENLSFDAPPAESDRRISPLAQMARSPKISG